MSLLATASRYAALFFARGVGLVRRGCSGWRLPLLAGVGIWGVTSLLPPGYRAWSRPRSVLTELGAVCLLCWVIRSRTRLVVTAFADHRGPEVRRLSGIGSLLVTELGTLHALYRVVDQSRAVPEQLKGPCRVCFTQDSEVKQAADDETLMVADPLDSPAPIRAEEVSDVLDAVTSIDATVNVAGVVKLPIGAIAGVIGRLARGPRLTGSIHTVGGSLVVTARTVGSGMNGLWRVQGDAAAEPEDLLDELALRIFTDMSASGAVKWRATRANVEGLRAYRKAMGTKRERRVNLELAKDRFIETIAEDSAFGLANYNLGVVALELGQNDAAESAFLTSIALNNRRPEAYYALAQLYFSQNRTAEVLTLCGRLHQLSGHRAEIYHLEAIAQGRRRCPEAAMKARKASLRRSWVRLCLAAARNREAEARRLAAVSLRNLAGLHAFEAKEQPWVRQSIGYRAAARELRQARFLTPSDAEMSFELGKVYAAAKHHARAARELRRAVQISPDRVRIWTHLARALSAQRSTREEAKEAVEEALKQPSQLADRGFKRLVEVSRRLDEPELEGRATALREFEARRKKWREDAPAVAELEDLLKATDSKDVWQTAQTCVELVSQSVATSNRDSALRAAKRLTDVLPDLTKKYPAEVRRGGHQAVAAEALAISSADYLETARCRVEAAITRDPLSCRARKAQASIHEQAGELEKAVQAWRGALACDPDHSYLNLQMGECLVRWALESHQQEHRLGHLREAVPYLHSALTLYDLEQPGEEASESEKMLVARGHLWLGRALSELGDHEAAITYLRLCCALDTLPVGGLRLGLAYLRAGSSREAEDQLSRVVSLAGCRAGTDPGAFVGTPGDQLTAAELLAWGQIHLARSRIERDALVPDAVAALRAIAENPSGSLSPRIRAAASDWAGWGLWQTGRRADGLALLRSSINLEATAGSYRHLALLHAALAAGAGDEGRRRRYAGTAARYAEQALRMGANPGHTEELQRMLRRLNATAGAPAPAGRDSEVLQVVLP